MFISVISLFVFRVLLGLFSLSSSLEESESVASWSVRMIRTSFLWVFLLVLHGGSPSKTELGVASFSFCSLRVDCTDMPLKCVRESEGRKKKEGFLVLFLGGCQGCLSEMKEGVERVFKGEGCFCV